MRILDNDIPDADRDDEAHAFRLIQLIKMISGDLAAGFYATVAGMTHIPSADKARNIASLRTDLDDLLLAHAVKWVGDMGGRL